MSSPIFQKRLEDIKDQIIELEQERRIVAGIALFSWLIAYRDTHVPPMNHLVVNMPYFGDQLSVFEHTRPELAQQPVDIVKRDPQLKKHTSYIEVRYAINWDNLRNSVVVLESDTVLSLIDKYFKPEYIVQAQRYFLNTFTDKPEEVPEGTKKKNISAKI